MENKGNYFLVGLFTLAFSFGLMYFGAWVMGATSQTYPQKLVIYFPGDVNGIAPGSVVKYRGLQVGKVDAVVLDQLRPQYIKVLTRVDAGLPLRESTTVELVPQGITGLNFIEMETSDFTAPQLKAEPGKNHWVLYAKESTLSILMKEAPKLIRRFTKVADNLLVLLDKENLDAVSHTLKNAELFTQNIVQHQQEINKIFDETKNVLEQLKTMSTSSFSELNYFLRDSREAAIEFKNLGKSLQENPSKIIYKPSYNGYKVAE
jgi:phospholipid/cholesterol/gamma-HCH transport system substrate-binding protein